VADPPHRYKVLPRGTWGGPPLGVPTDAHRHAEYVVEWLQRQMDLAHGVEVRWFAPAGPLDWDGDPGVFASEVPIWGCVRKADPQTACLNLALTRASVGKLIRVLVHEVCHVEQLQRPGVEGRYVEDLERAAEDLTALLCAGVA
jgi:hypothetical protein